MTDDLTTHETLRAAAATDLVAAIEQFDDVVRPIRWAATDRRLTPHHCSEIVETLSQRLEPINGRSLSSGNLHRMAKFARLFPDR